MSKHKHNYIETGCSYYYDWGGVHVKRIKLICSVCGKKKIAKRMKSKWIGEIFN